jgi:hypothetical protein
MQIQFLRNYYTEVFYLLEHDEKTLYYTYITYDNKKLEGFPAGYGNNDYSFFRLKAWANVPISNSEIVRMRLYLLKNKEIEDFTVQYETVVDPKIRKKILLPLKPEYTEQDIHKLLIRSDYGHKDKQQNKLKHTNVEVLNVKGNKINKDDNMSFIDQSFDVPNYEMAVHYVFMQAEKYNPLIGAYYWISPFGIHDNRVGELYKLWQEAQLSTPLCILARNVNISIIKFVDNSAGRDVPDNKFKELAINEINECKDVERLDPENIRLSQLETQSGVIWYPFPLFKPDEQALHGFFKIEKLKEDEQIALSFEKILNQDKTSRVI